MPSADRHFVTHDRGLGTEQGLSVRQLLERGDLVAAARREADAAERDGYDVTADLLRQLADAVEGKSHAR